MRNKKIIEAWNKVEPSEEVQERMLNNILEKSSGKRKSPQWKPLATVAAAAVVLMAGTFIYNNINTNKHISDSQQINENQISTDQDQSTVDLTDLSDEIKGLPVKNFKMSEIQQNIAADRIAFFNFINFFEYEVDSFVIVKVGDTKAVSAEEYQSETQISTVKVLETVWGDNVPDSIEITQYLYGGCTGDEATNLMRKGGVYLLPLIEDNGNYYLMSDLDVLFEIDDEGRIWSHSDFEDFNRFDGEDYKAVTDEIKRITQDETIMLTSSRFGMAMRGFQLAEVTIVSEGKEETNEYGYAEVAYNVRVERTLSGNDLTSEVSIRSYADEDLPLNNGDRYLLFIDNYDENHYINTNMIARVEADGTIQNLGDERGPFAALNGSTVEKIQELADKVTDYISTNQE